MTAALLHLAVIYAACAILFALACLIAHATDRRNAIDAHTRQHRERPSKPCPWCDVARAPSADVQQHQAGFAKRRTEDHRLKMLGHHGGADFQQAEYAEASMGDLDAELAELLGGEGA